MERLTLAITKIRTCDFLSVAFSLVTVLWCVINVAGEADTKLSGQLPCEFRDSVNISSGTRNALGNIVHNDIVYTSQNFALINYDYVEHDVRVSVSSYYRGCICQVSKCVRLCCPIGQWYLRVGETTNCVDKSDDFPVILLTNVTTITNEIRLGNIFEEKAYGFLPQKPCPELLIEDIEQWALDDSGSIILREMVIPQEEYCLAVQDDTGVAAAYFCPLVDQASITHSIGLILSIPFLIATLLIYACIPELRNIHGKSLICYIFALTNSFVVLLIMHFRSNIIPCEAQGYMLYFFVLVAFFWLNVMCFDIFWTFSSGVVIKNERKRFLYYSLYAWGCPLIAVVLVAVFENTELIVEHLRPGFGINNCWFYTDKMVQFLYLYLPLLVLIAANLYFFIVTAVRIIRVQRATEAALKNDSGRHNRFEHDRYRYTLYLRLFIVMGVTWTFEILSWAMENSIWIFYVVDVCNCLLGVMIFFLFVWKQKVRKLVAKRTSSRLSSNKGHIR
ncbi:G-protein coupled receptor Mth2-like isoform X3 [Armigeres subalbatus]|uniref:G-protein coupled receptor Mth2-like isoform X3 n=1 Tax=Armigeres subalbatus TaxID=124917 RepID=UPI002ED010D1